jgi:hypothetical protein
MSEEVLAFSSDDGVGFKEYIDSRAGSYVLAGPGEPSGGQLTLHTARCMHIKENKTARLIAPGEVRIVAPTARRLMKWIQGNDRAGQPIEGCNSCKTTDLVDRYAR